MNTQTLLQNSTHKRAVSWRKVARALVLVPLTAFVATGAIGRSEADSASLAGSWSGGGWVSFSTGSREKARCRARYSRVSSSSYTVSATCATASGKASQTATVHKVTSNRYRGSFYNSDFNVRGSIRVVVRGRSQSVSLSGDGASASLSLSKR